MNKGKELIKKGLELDDDELIKLGYELIAKENSKNAQKLIKSTKKEKKSTKVLTTQPESVNIEQPARDPMDFSMQVRQLDKPAARKQTTVDEDGNVVEYTIAKSVPIDLEKIKLNIFDDDGTEERDDKFKVKTKTGKKISWDKIQGKNKPVPRNRQQELTKVKCNNCGKEELVNPIFAAGSVYYCNRCIKKKGSII